MIGDPHPAGIVTVLSVLSKRKDQPPGSLWGRMKGRYCYVDPGSFLVCSQTSKMSPQTLLRHRKPGWHHASGDCCKDCINSSCRGQFQRESQDQVSTRTTCQFHYTTGCSIRLCLSRSLAELIIDVSRSSIRNHAYARRVICFVAARGIHPHPYRHTPSDP